jgi:hypothetical protein
VDFYILCNFFVLQQIANEWYITEENSQLNQTAISNNTNGINKTTTTLKATGNIRTIRSQVKKMIKDKCRGRAAGQIDIDGERVSVCGGDFWCVCLCSFSKCRESLVMQFVFSNSMFINHNLSFFRIPRQIP